ncbi:MAG: hypothetical protein L6461_22450 [Anaerolineae bacterium]|nr:hypothetical protein [Anaerolineae bacterium]
MPRMFLRTGSWAGRGLCLGAEKTRSQGKMLDCEVSRTRQSPASGKRFLGWRSVVQGLLAVKEAACIKLEKELKECRKNNLLFSYQLFFFPVELLILYIKWGEKSPF